jgi:hypothetical protein
LGPLDPERFLEEEEVAEVGDEFDKGDAVGLEVLDAGKVAGRKGSAPRLRSEGRR